jgi:hypothetical protein
MIVVSSPLSTGSRIRAALLSAAFAVPLTAALGCEAPQTGGGIEVSESPALGSENGLKAYNGLKAHNGLTLLTGLTQASGLAASSELMSTSDGRLQVAYLIKCALPATRTVVKTDSRGTKYTFAGELGLAPEWETSSCGQACQEWVSACLLAFENTTGKHVPIWMVAEHPAIGFGLSPDYPRQEGAFFGNIFAPNPSEYYCGGRDYAVSPVPGRIGSPQVDTSYTNINGPGGTCKSACTGSDSPHVGDGFKSCSHWNRVITIWRR